MPFMAIPAVAGTMAALGGIGGLASGATSIGMAADQLSKQNAAIARNKERQEKREEIMSNFGKGPGALGASTADSALGPSVAPDAATTPAGLPSVTKKMPRGY